MQKALIAAIVMTGLVPTFSYSEDWASGTNEGSQGINGAYAMNPQDGLFDLSFTCSAFEELKGDVFMKLNTMSDAPLQHGNETQFPITMSFAFKNDSRKTLDIEVEWQREEAGINIWYSRFPMDKPFLRYFARSTKLELLSGSMDDVIFTYSMGGSNRAADAFYEYCYSGNHN